MVKRMMVSQPMRGKTEDEIVAARERALQYASDHGFEFVNTKFTDWEPNKDDNIALQFLVKSLENMVKCQVVYFSRGWEEARGCVVEHEAAQKYELEIIYEDADR